MSPGLLPAEQGPRGTVLAGDIAGSTTTPASDAALAACRSSDKIVAVAFGASRHVIGEALGIDVAASSRTSFVAKKLRLPLASQRKFDDVQRA